jgi:hypothetical protein
MFMAGRTDYNNRMRTRLWRVWKNMLQQEVGFIRHIVKKQPQSSPEK